MNTDLITRQHTLPIGNLETYIHWANQFPMLSEEEELDLATACYKNHDLEAARKLILSHLRFVIRIARGYQGYGLPLSDLIQEGSIGLMKAVKRFDPAVGVRLVSFAVHWIKSEIHDFVLKNWRIVKVATTKAQRKLFFNLRKHTKNKRALSPSDVTMIAESLDVSESAVITMHERLSSHDESYNHGLDDSEDNIGYAPKLIDNRYSPTNLLLTHNQHQDRQDKLTSALNQLDSRSQIIIKARWLTEIKSTLQSLSEQLGVSSERIRQIEQAAFKKLHEILKTHDDSANDFFEA